MTTFKPFSLFVAWTLLMLYKLLKRPPHDVTHFWFNFPHADKVIHVLIFAVFAGLLVAALAKREWKWLLMIGLTASLIWGVATEAMQGMFTTYRTADWQDVVADVFGGALGVLFFLQVRKYRWYKRFLQPLF